MASRYRKIDPRIWTDEKFRQLSGEQQRVALYVLTAQSNRIGLFSFSPGKACEDLRVGSRAFLTSFVAVCQALRWEWDADSRVIYLPTWWKYNQPESVNNLIGNLKDLDDLPNTALFSRFASNTLYLSEGLRETFSQALADRYPEGSPQGSPDPSPTQEQEQEQEQKQERPPAVADEFEEFWNLYPMRDGKRLEKAEARRKWAKLKPCDRAQILIAVRHYATSRAVASGIGIKNAHRWLRNGKGDEPWREWIEPEQIQTQNGQELVCAARVQRGQFLKPCGNPAVPGSRPHDPRCLEHLAGVPAERNGHASH